MPAHSHQRPAPSPTPAPAIQTRVGGSSGAGAGNAARASLLQSGNAQNRSADMAAFRAQERREGSNASHMSFLDRGLGSSRYKADQPRIGERLAATPQELGAVSAPAQGAPAFPTRGQLPGPVGAMDWLHPDITHASVAVGTVEDGDLRARWYGRNDKQNTQLWSATKQLQAYATVSEVNKKRPDLDIDQMRIRAGASGRSTGFYPLMQDITSYDAGVGGSNGGAATLGSFRPREGRERFLESHTGNDVTFRGNYGAPLTHASPQLVGPDGQTLLQAPGSDGTPGRNIIGAYDLTRMNAMAAWHHDLKPDQRIDGAQWHSLESVMRAMGEDSARYVDAAIQRLEMGDQLKDVVVATKLGHGPANGKAETVYSGVVEFTDTRQSPPVRRSVSFTLKGVHGDAVELDARMASEVTELMRRVLDGSL